MKNFQLKKEKETIILGIAGIKLAVVFVVFNFSEFYQVGIQGETGGYPFGGKGPTPWYYRSAQDYAVYQLGSDLSFSWLPCSFYRVFCDSGRRLFFITFCFLILLIMIIQVMA